MFFSFKKRNGSCCTNRVLSCGGNRRGVHLTTNAFGGQRPWNAAPRNQKTREEEKKEKEKEKEKEEEKEKERRNTNTNKNKKKKQKKKRVEEEESGRREDKNKKRGTIGLRALNTRLTTTSKQARDPLEGQGNKPS